MIPFKMVRAEIRFDRSWIIVSTLITWTLAQGIFPYYYKQLSIVSYWWMALSSVAGLFISVFLHELSHILISSLTASPIKIIRLYFFGGVFDSDVHSISVGHEISIALVGPIANLFIFLFFQIILIIGKNRVLPLEVGGIFDFLRVANLIIALFNFLPVCPLDGGRIARVLLWKLSGNMEWATKVCSVVGTALGLLMVTGGIMLIVRGILIGGIWWILIGIFLQGASRLSYQKYLTRKTLEGVKVRSFMNTCPVIIPAEISINCFVQKFVYKYHHKLFPVVNERDELVGGIYTRNAISVPVEEWDFRTVEEIASPLSIENTIGENVDAVAVFSAMSKGAQSRMIVLDSKNRLRGILGLKDFLKFLSFKLEFGKEGENKAKNCFLH